MTQHSISLLVHKRLSCAVLTLIAFATVLVCSAQGAPAGFGDNSPEVLGWPAPTLAPDDGVRAAFVITENYQYIGEWGGPALQGELSWPRGVAVDTSGYVYIADMGHNRVRRLFFQDPGALASDFDGNGMVDFEDFFLFAAAFGTRKGEAGFSAKYDLDGNGTIGFDDFFLFATDFGKNAG